jgi:CRISPR-associated exonuclease Cas4
LQFEEDELLPISALQHLLFCERRVALVYLEGLWDDNVFTIEGGLLHERADEPETEVRGDMHIVRGLRLRSLRLGLSGKADVVEFHRVPEGEEGGVCLEGAGGRWRPVPVEYKRGRLRHEEGYEVQLCAQAMCLEEMLNVVIPAGAVFYGKTRRRLEIAFDEKLRRETEAAVRRLHELLKGDATPQAIEGPKCRSCSLVDLCLPEAAGGRKSAARYLSRAIAETMGGAQ